MDTFFFLAKKFLGKRHQESFIWLTSCISIVGIAVGVASLMIVLGVMDGFSNDLKEKIIGSNPNIIIEGSPYLADYKEISQNLKAKFPEITDIGYFAQTQTVFKSNKYLVGGYLRGIDSENEKLGLGKFLKSGSINIENGLVLGTELAKELGVTVGDTLTLMSGFPPAVHSYKVVGLVEYGIYNVDVSLGVISLANFQRDIFNGEQMADIGIKIKDFYQSDKVSAKMMETLPFYCKTTTWIKQNKILFSALALEKKAMILILTIIILIASFNITSSLMMTVYRKIKEIGVLKTIGMTSGEIRRVFIYQGLILGTRGLILGLVIGGMIVYFLKTYKVVKLPEFIYNISYLPLEISLKEIVVISVSVIFMTLLASLFPAYRAGKMEAATALRYE